MRIQPVNLPNDKRLPEENVIGTWGRMILAMSKYRPVAWLVFLTASLVLFLLSERLRLILSATRLVGGLSRAVIPARPSSWRR